MRFKLAILFALFLVACSSTPPVETPTPALQAIATQATALPPVTPTLSGNGCTILSTEPTSTPNSFIPAIQDTDYSFGPVDAPVTIIEYCDFQAPICRSMAAVVANLSARHPDQIRLVFRPIPLSGQLDKTDLAVQAAITAGDQGKFWAMYDVLFVHSDQWDALTPGQFEAWVTEQAVGLGLDGDEFQVAMKSPETAARSQSLFNSARDFGLQAVPLLIINGSPQPSFAIDYNSIESTVSLILLAGRQFQTCPRLTIDPSVQYTATLHTEKGDIVLDLYADKAPIAVNSFIFLARQGWYDGISFHRVIPGFMAQAGDPTGTGRGNPGYLFKNEIDPNLKFDQPGLLAMANSGPDTNGSQFFITFAPQPSLDGQYTIFGRVLRGMDVLESLTARDPASDFNPPEGDKILGVEIVEK